MQSRHWLTCLGTAAGFTLLNFGVQFLGGRHDYGAAAWLSLAQTVAAVAVGAGWAWSERADGKPAAAEAEDRDDAGDLRW